MTGRRARLARLEARRRESEVGDVVGIFEADPGAGLWREVNGPRSFPLSLDALEDAERQAAAGGALLMISPIGGSKIIPGLRGEDL